MTKTDIARRVYNHTWKLDPIVRSLLDTDFYKLLMLQMIWGMYPKVDATFSLINRSTVRLADEIDEGELREQLDHARTLRFSKKEMIWLGGNTFYGRKQIFEQEFLAWLENFRLPDYHLEKRGGQYELTFAGPWMYTTLWEIPALAIINELRSRAAMKDFGPFALDVLYARAKARMWDKTERLKKLPGINIFRSAIFIPALVTTVAWTLVWRFILQPQGLLDSITAMVDAGPFPWLRGGWLTLAVFAGIQLTKNVGINVMIFLAALQGVREDLIDAGRVDGAGRWKTFRHIVLPQISPAILMVFMLMISGSFKVFELVLLLTNGGPGVQTTVLAFEIFRQAFRLNDIGYAAAVSVLLFALVLVTTGIIWLSRRRLVFYESN